MRKITLEDRELIVDRFNALSLDLSNYTFANLYMFRYLQRGVHSLIEDENLWLIGRMRDQTPYMMPTVAPDAVRWERARQLTREQGGSIFPLPEEWTESYRENGFSISCDRDDSDYLVETAKMAHYSGRHLQAKRNLVSQFCRLYASHSRDIELPRDREAVEELLMRWQTRAKGTESETDFISIQTALDNFTELELRGRVTWVDSQLVALLIGQPLNATTFVIYAAKADVELKGVYQYAFMDFAQQIERSYPYLNLEEDIGIDSLRRSKLSYKPIQLLHKYRAGF